MGTGTTGWLPTTAREVKQLEWDYIDVILFSGDAYVDHPSFGAAVIGRLLQQAGYRVAIVPQPNWRDDLRDFKKLGKPRLFFAVSGGAMDSMVNHYTANLRLRSDDAYTPGGKAGFRPDRAVTVYSRILKQLFPEVPVIIGGIEASLRRLTHYDYWEDRLMPSVLADSGADFLLYGMGDRVIPELARMMSNGFNAKLIKQLRQVAYLEKDTGRIDAFADKLILNSYEQCLGDRKSFAANFKVIETETNRYSSDTVIVEPVAGNWVVVNPAFPPLTQAQTDHVFDLPYTRLPHPRYNGKGSIPAYEMIKHSVTLHRGCFGGCSFCTISAHQGKFISSRSEGSVMGEVEKITTMPDFRGVITDIGGPSANMYGMKGHNMELCKKCVRPSCLYPAPCRNLDRSHDKLLRIYRKVRNHNGVRKVFVGSGIRYDLPEGRDAGTYWQEVLKYHTSGRLKVAPEHTEKKVLDLMRKPPFEQFLELHKRFNTICRAQELNYRITPYFIASHPGSTASDMERLRQKVSGLGLHLEQSQGFTPTPMTLSSVMYFTGMDPYTGKEVFVERDIHRKQHQKDILVKRAKTR